MRKWLVLMGRLYERRCGHQKDGGFPAVILFFFPLLSTHHYRENMYISIKIETVEMYPLSIHYSSFKKTPYNQSDCTDTVPDKKVAEVRL